jgi:hypothetical protein
MLQQAGDWETFRKRLASIKTESVKDVLLDYMRVEHDLRYWDIVLQWKKYERKIAAKGGEAQ